MRGIRNFSKIHSILIVLAALLVVATVATASILYVRYLGMLDAKKRAEAILEMFTDQIFFNDPSNPMVTKVGNSTGLDTAPNASSVSDSKSSPPSAPASTSADKKTEVSNSVSSLENNLAPEANPGASTVLLWSNAQQAVQDYVNQLSGIDWAVSVRNASTGDLLLSAGVPDKPFTAASTTKLLTACAFLQKVEQKQYSLDDQIGAFPADFQLHELINQSDNDSWALFNNLLGGENLENYSHSIGVNSFIYDGNFVKPSEMSLMLSKLYQGQLLSPEHTKLLLSYMQNTEEERFLPPSIPAGVTLYHKIGLLEGLVHDVGLVDDKVTPLSEAFYSDGHGNQNYDDRALNFHSIENIIFTEAPK